MSTSHDIKPLPLVRTAGLTLIEVMVVILVLAMLGVYSLSMLKNEIRSLAEDKAVIEIKQYLEAAQNYFVDNNQWPTDFATDLTTGGYLPQTLATANSPWVGFSYEGSAGQNPGQPPGLYYTVSVNTPSMTVAKRIAARVPYGQTNNAKVSGSIPVPGALQGYVASAGILRLRAVDNAYDPGKSDNVFFDTPEQERIIDLPKCSPGFEGHYFLSHLAYSTGYSCYGGDDWDSDKKKCQNPGVVVRIGYGDIKGNKGANYVFVGDNLETNLAFFASKLQINAVYPHYLVYYMTYCIPNGSWLNVNNAAPSANDSQCKFNWAGNGNNMTSYNQYGKSC